MSADMRSLSHQLHSSRLDLVGWFRPSVVFARKFTNKYKIGIIRGARLPRKLTKDVELCLFRVAQEGLSNVVKHSGASSAGSNSAAAGMASDFASWIRARDLTPDLKSPGDGTGLIGMRERLRLVGGRLTVRSELTRGTEVLAELPLSAAVNKEHATTHAEEALES